MFGSTLVRCRHARYTAALALILAQTGCFVVGPDYTPLAPPAADVPTQWTSRTPADHPSFPETKTTRPQWWEELDDASLDRLVSSALDTSPTLEAALARLRQASLAITHEAAKGKPAVEARADNRQTSTDNGDTDRTRSWLAMDASWEIDLFGAVRRGQEGAIARAAAQQASLADARVSLSADVTLAYLDFRACQSQVTLAEQDIASRAATQRLTADSVREGFMPPYQAIRSAASVAEAKTLLSATRARCEQLENLLTRQTGVARPELAKLLAERPTGLDRLPIPRHLGIRVPANALLQRPDLRVAERRLAAASADIGLAEADRYPRLTLNGAFAYAFSATEGRGVLSLGTWSFGPSLSLPVFDAGRRAASVEIARARYDEAQAGFRSATRLAVQEIEDALTRYAAANERAESAEASARLYRQFFNVIEMRYREGASNLLELEDARRAMLNAEKTLLGVRLERLQAWVALHRATGGNAEYPAAASIDGTATTHDVGRQDGPV